MADLVSHPDEVKVVSKRFGLGATDIDRYLELDGYKAVQKALGMTPDAIIARSRHRVARTRWSGIPHGNEVVVRSERLAESEIHPVQWRRERAGHLQRPLDSEHDPHSVIEGVMIAGLAVNAQSGYIYIRGEYRYLSIIMQKAIRDAYAKGFLGKNISGAVRPSMFIGMAARVHTKWAKSRR